MIVDVPSDYATFTPPAKKDEAGVSLSDAMASLWEIEDPPEIAPPSVPASRTIYIAPPKMVLPEGPTKTFRELGIFDKKAQWIGALPAPDTVYVEMLCEMCTKAMWTRRPQEGVCEMCYLHEIDKLRDLRMQAPTGERFVNPLR